MVQSRTKSLDFFCFMSHLLITPMTRDSTSGKTSSMFLISCRSRSMTSMTALYSSATIPLARQSNVHYDTSRIVQVLLNERFGGSMFSMTLVSYLDVRSAGEILERTETSNKTRNIDDGKISFIGPRSSNAQGR